MKYFATVLLLLGNFCFLATAAESPIQKELRIGDLKRLKETLASDLLTHEDRSKFSQDSYIFIKPNEMELIRAGYVLSKTLRTWLFLGDASDTNPLLSHAFKDLRDGNPACLRQIFLEVVDRGLAPISDPVDRQRVLEIVFAPVHLDPAQAVTPHSLILHSTSLGFYSGFEGTRSGSVRSISPDLKKNIDFLKEIWGLGTSPESRLSKVAEAQRETCSQTYLLRELFPWTDFSAAQNLFTSSPEMPLRDRMRAIEKLASTTAVPETQDPLGPAAFIGSLALRPSPSVILDATAVSPAFYQAFFRLLERSAYDKGGNHLTPQTCVAVSRLAAWASFNGIEVSAFAAGRAQQGLGFREVKEAHRILVSLAAAMNGDKPDWKLCRSAFVGILQIWNSLIDMEYYMHATYGDRRWRFDDSDLAFGFVNGRSLIGLPLNGLKSLGYGLTHPTFKAHFIIKQADQWTGLPPARGFAFKVHRVKDSSLSVKKPSDASFDPKVIEAQNSPTGPLSAPSFTKILDGK